MSPWIHTASWGDTCWMVTSDSIPICEIPCEGPWDRALGAQAMSKCNWNLYDWNIRLDWFYSNKKGAPVKGLKKANCPATVRQRTEPQGWPAAHGWDLKAADRTVAEDDPSVFHASTEVISSSKLFIYRGKSILQFINVPIVLEKSKSVTIGTLEHSPPDSVSFFALHLFISLGVHHTTAWFHLLSSPHVRSNTYSDNGMRWSSDYRKKTC